MTSARTSIVALNLLVALVFQPQSEPSVADTAPVSVAPAPVTVAAISDPGTRIVTERHRHLAEWALERYANAGLDLPNLEISIHPDTGNCKGNNGLYRNTGDHIEIHVCAPWPSRIERALLHELGHAWADTTLTATQRHTFVELRGLDVWDGGAWEERGFEHAAEILTWGLSEEAFSLTSIADTDTHDLTEAFHQLTGIDPINTPPQPNTPTRPTGGHPLE